MSWEKVILKNFCVKIGSGATPKGGKRVYTDIGTSLIRSQNVYNLHFSHEGLAHITAEAAKKLDYVAVENNDVLFNITGDSVARTCIVPDDVLPARVNQHVAIIRPEKGSFDPKFLNYYLASPFMQSYLLNRAAGKGASRNAITKEMIEKLEVPFPPTIQQKRIVSVLSAYDKLIKNNRKQIKLLEEAAQRLYKEWFIDLKFPGWETTPIDPTTHLPEGWKIVELRSLCNFISRGVTPKYDNESNQMVLGQTCIRNNLVILENARNLKLEKEANKWLRFGDVLVNSTGVGSLGRTAQVWFTPSNLIVDSHVTIIRANDSAFSLLIGFWAFRSEDSIEALHTRSTGQTELPKDRLGSMTLRIPDAVTLKAFNSFALPVVSSIVDCQSLILKAQEARDRLLPKLMSGEIEV